MATKIWYPEPGDKVKTLSGNVGAVHPDWSASLGTDEDSWLVVVSLNGGMLLRYRVPVVYSERNNQWEEVEKGT